MQEIPDKPLRIIGVGLFLAGVILAYVYAFLPLEAAKNHAPEIQLSSKLIFLAPAAAIFGGAMAVFGKRGREAIQSEHNGKMRLTLVGWILMAICVAAGIGFNEWLKAAMVAYGY